MAQDNTLNFSNLKEVLAVGDSLTAQVAEMRAEVALATAAPGTNKTELLLLKLDRINEAINVFKLSVSKAIEQVTARCDRIERRLDDMEAQGRRKILLFHGVPEANGENISDVAHSIIVSKIKPPDFSSSHITLCHRLGRPVTGSQRPRPVLVRFSDVAARSLVWDRKTSLKGSGVTASEFLIAGRHQIFMEARRRLGVNRCWTRDGQVFILSPDGAKQRVSTMQRLQELADVNVSAPGSNNKFSMSTASTMAKQKPATRGTGGAKTVPAAQAQAGVTRNLRSTLKP